MSLKNLRSDLKELSNPLKAKILEGFFKTAKGEYGEGDIFLGIGVPKIRKIAVKYQNLSTNEIESLLFSKIHEERFVALEILVIKYEKSKESEKSKIFTFYIKNAKFVNNWDLVDTSAPYISGEYLMNKDKKVLYKLAKSDNLWEKRISIVSTYTFIRAGKFNDCLRISEILLNDKNDLIHKAVGWMLREVGKRDKLILEKFLKRHYKIMPRTMLRYSIEKFSQVERKKYLKSKI